MLMFSAGLALGVFVISFLVMGKLEKMDEAKYLTEMELESEKMWRESAVLKLRLKLRTAERERDSYRDRLRAIEKSAHDSFIKKES